METINRIEHEGGFTLIEVLMALSLLLVGVLIIMGSFKIVATLSIRYSQKPLEAARQGMERLLLESIHPIHSQYPFDNWFVQARTRREGRLVHYHVGVFHTKRDTTPVYTLYTARLATDHASQ